MESIGILLLTSRRSYALKEGDGAFHGPKIDFDVTDSIERAWQAPVAAAQWRSSFDACKVKRVSAR